MTPTSQELESRMAALVVTKDTWRERTRLGTATSLGLISVIFAAAAVGWVAREAAMSGFGDYLSLVFSDSAFVFSHLREFLLSLLESLPALTLAGLLGAVAIFAAVLPRAYRSLRRARLKIISI